MKTLLTALVAFMLPPILNATSTITGFYCKPSEVGSSLVVNKEGYLIPDNMAWIFKSSIHPFYGKNAVEFNISGPTYWTLDIRMPNDSPLYLGNFVGTRFPFNESNSAGFSFFGNGGGCNTSTTFFDILEVKYTNGEISSLAIDFVQYEETGGITTGLSLGKNKGVFGSYRYNSTFEIVPETSSFTITLLGCIGFLKRRR